jgi:SAM-dependent methyltransferase
MRLARLALVDEERDRRMRALGSVQHSLEQLGANLERQRQDSRRNQRENSAILRLLRGDRSGDADASSAPGASFVSRSGLFTEIERGSRAEVIAKFAPYVERFRGKEPVADLGCGRGEFIEVAGRGGVSAYGVDTDPDAVTACRERGLDVRQEDLVEHLRALPDDSIGGVFCAQVVEHLPPDLLSPVLDEVARVLRPGGVVVIETPNPATFATHVQSFWRDPTHIRPVPEAALSFAARSAGLMVDDVLYTSPVAEGDRLQPLQLEAASPEVRTLTEGINRTIEQLNDLLYGFQDYTLVASKPA